MHIVAYNVDLKNQCPAWGQESLEVIYMSKVVGSFEFDGSSVSVLKARSDEKPCTMVLDREVMMRFGSVKLRQDEHGCFLEVWGPVSYGLTSGWARARDVRFDQPGTYNISKREIRTDHPQYPIVKLYGYRVVPPEEETDPILRILREFRISPKALKRAPEKRSFEFKCLRDDIFREEIVLTDGKVTACAPFLESGRCEPQRRGVRITDGTFAVVVDNYTLFSCPGGYDMEMDACRVSRVYVRPDANPDMLGSVLAYMSESPGQVWNGE